MRHLPPILFPLLAFLLFFAALGSPGQAVAQPAPAPRDELEVWPPPGTSIPIDGVLLLEGSGFYRERFEKIVGGAMLEAKGRRIKLNILQLGPGEHQGSLQVLLAPAVPLQTNTEYTLRLALGAPTNELISPRIRMPGGTREPARWRTLGYRTQPLPTPRIVGEVQRYIACRIGDAENGFDLTAKVEGLDAHSLVKLRVYQRDPSARAGAAAPPPTEEQAIIECLARGWSDNRDRTSFRTCSLPPSLPPGPLQIEVRPMNAQGQLGEAVTLEQSWRGTSL